MDDTPTYEEVQAEIRAEQSQKSYDEIREEMLKESNHLVELDKLQPVKHLWIDRGAVQSCENAGHPYHQAWIRQR